MTPCGHAEAGPTRYHGMGLIPVSCVVCCVCGQAQTASMEAATEARFAPTPPFAPQASLIEALGIPPEEVPEDFLDPITQQYMLQPVLLNTARTPGMTAPSLTHARRLQLASLAFPALPLRGRPVLSCDGPMMMTLRGDDHLVRSSSRAQEPSWTAPQCYGTCRPTRRTPTPRRPSPHRCSSPTRSSPPAWRPGSQASARLPGNEPPRGQGGAGLSRAAQFWLVSLHDVRIPEPSVEPSLPWPLCPRCCAKLVVPA